MAKRLIDECGDDDRKTIERAGCFASRARDGPEVEKVIAVPGEQAAGLRSGRRRFRAVPGDMNASEFVFVD